MVLLNHEAILSATTAVINAMIHSDAINPKDIEKKFDLVYKQVVETMTFSILQTEAKAKAMDLKN